ncbi:hypothetical protein ACOSQ2_031414 [Xanthoceras sorbifolium]
MKLNPLCPLCLCVRETTFHSLRGCKKLELVRSGYNFVQRHLLLSSSADPFQYCVACGGYFSLVSYLEDYHEAHLRPSASVTRLPTLAKWYRPPSDLFKINTDATVERPQSNWNRYSPQSNWNKDYYP